MTAIPATVFIRLATGEELEASDTHLAALGYQRAGSGRVAALKTLLADPALTRDDVFELLSDPQVKARLESLGVPVAGIDPAVAAARRIADRGLDGLGSLLSSIDDLLSPAGRTR